MRNRFQPEPRFRLHVTMARIIYYDSEALFQPEPRFRLHVTVGDPMDPFDFISFNRSLGSAFM